MVEEREMAKLTAAAKRMLEAGGFSEVAEDYVVHGSTDVRILLCRRAVIDLNAQADGDPRTHEHGVVGAQE